MEEQLREQAEKKVQNKLAFYYCVVVFFAVIVVLLALSFYLPGAAFWLRLPIPVLIMVLGFLFISAYGPPTANGISDDWEAEEIEKEMAKLRRRKNIPLPPLEDLSETEILELKELDRLQQKWNPDNEDFV